MQNELPLAEEHPLADDPEAYFELQATPVASMN